MDKNWKDKLNNVLSTLIDTLKLNEEAPKEEAPEVKEFVDIKDIDGNIIRYEVLEEGAEVFIITEEGELPLPDGLYELETGVKIDVMDGKIVSVIEPEVVEETPEVPEEEMKEEVKEEELVIDITELKSEIENLKIQLNEQKEQIELLSSINDNFEKLTLKVEKIAEQPAATPIKDVITNNKQKDDKWFNRL